MRSTSDTPRPFQAVIRFGLVGLSNTAIGLLVIFVMWRGFGWPDWAANASGYVVGFGWSYVWNRRWTFKSTTDVRRSLPRFALVSGVAYVANLASVVLSRNALGAETFVPHLVGTLVYTTVGFLGSFLFAFRDR